jgi:hypothetical protein
METAVGIFATHAKAKTAVERLLSSGVPSKSINILAPGDWEGHIAEVPTSDTEQPGTAKAIGGVVGGAMGASAGFGLGPILAGLFVPGIGAVTAIGFASAALLGAGGVVGGAVAGGAIEESLSDGLPKDELYVYEDALRKGRSVVVALLDSPEEAKRARHTLAGSGSESVDAAREEWWVGLREAEKADYETGGGEFSSATERMYRCGFEAAQRPDFAGKKFDDVRDRLREAYLDCWENQAFRLGFERGQQLRENNRARDAELAGH